jgi:hypothetical protein
MTKRVEIVPLEFFHQAWVDCSPLLDKAMVHSNGDCSLESLKVYITNGTYQLMVFVEDEKVVAAVVYFLRTTPSFNMFYIVALSGKTSHEHMDMMYNFAKANGADRVRYACRDSVARLSSMKYGFNKVYNTVEKLL